MELQSNPFQKMRYLLVFDLDGCLYKYSALPNSGFYALCDEANALAAQEVFPELSYEKARELSTLSFEKHHDCYGAFVDYAKEVGHDPVRARDIIFKRYHAILFDFLEERHPDFFEHTASTVEALARLSMGPFALAVLSHSCMQGWGKPVLKKMGALQYFEPHLLLGMDDYGYERKFENAEGMKRLIEISGYTPDRIIFVEDSWRNTHPAFRILGVKAALVHYDALAPDPYPEGVHWLGRTPSDLAEVLEREYGARQEGNPTCEALVLKA